MKLENKEEVSYVGATSEIATIIADESGNVSEKVEFYYGSLVGGEKWNSGTLVQSYA